jgi:hypothetical protein
MSSGVNLARIQKHVYSRSFLDWGFLILASCFQLASAKTTFTGATEFLSDSSILSGIVTFAIQAGLVLGGERIVQIVSGVQRTRTSLIPALLLTAITFCASVIFSGFGFFKHYAYAEGNRVTEFNLTAAQVRTLAQELERFRTATLAFAATEGRRLDDERRRQDARVNNSRLTAQARSISQTRRDQLAREIASLNKTQSSLTTTDVLGSTTSTNAAEMRTSLIEHRHAISNLLAQAMPNYLRDHPVPDGLPDAPAPADVQTAFKRDIEQRRTPALFSLAMASMVDLASLLALTCNIFVSTTEQRVMGLKRKIKGTWKSAFPLAHTNDTFGVVTIRVTNVPEAYEFEVVFNKPDWELMGSDLEADRNVIIERISHRYSGEQIADGFYNSDGARIAPDQPLLEQLNNDDVVCLQVAVNSGNQEEAA